MRYAKIRKMDISNGTGIRVSLFVQGCDFRCKGCFNTDTWSFDGGKELTTKEMALIYELLSKPYIEGLSILGGEPLHPKNRECIKYLVDFYKTKFPDKNIWLWTGYKYEEVKDLELLKNIDVLVDGQFIEELHDFRLEFRGSSNQRILRLKNGKL